MFQKVPVSFQLFMKLLYSHLRDVGDGIHLHLGGAEDLWGGRVQDLHGDRQQQTGSEGHALAQSIVQVLVLVHQGVLACRAVHIGPGRTQGRQEP